MGSQANDYVRNVLHAAEAPPPIPVRYFYMSPLAIDDPLSPLPPPTTTATASRRHPPRPFSEFDNNAIDKAWMQLRRRILKHNEDLAEKRSTARIAPTPGKAAQERMQRNQHDSMLWEDGSRRSKVRQTASSRSSSRGQYSRSAEVRSHSESQPPSAALLATTLPATIRGPEQGDHCFVDEPTITGKPFIRAPSRGNPMLAAASGSMEAGRRPITRELDSYHWDESMEMALSGSRGQETAPSNVPPVPDCSAKVPVGVSRLHHVVMEAGSMRMEPIYWSPVNDVAEVVRGTWFYKETMLPVEIDVANLLEAGYLDLKPWTQTWADELNSAVEVGAAGEMKILHKLWPDKPQKPDSRPTSSSQVRPGAWHNISSEADNSPERELKASIEHACDLLDISAGLDGPDNKASGDRNYSHDGRKNLYRHAGVIYANAKEAYLLRPSLHPSEYYGRRPLANYIRKGRSIGIRVCRGFNQEIWDRLHPSKVTTREKRAHAGASTAQAGVPPRARQKVDPDLALSERPHVSDLVLVIHGIGQKLSERIETYHFTHAINAFRREVNVELAASDIQRHLRSNAGGIMVLPVNWRQRVTLEGGSSGEDEIEDPAVNQYSLKDITPDTLPAVRNIVSDVMLDIPYYLSSTHHPKMVTACINEANRIYRLWCRNNPGFAEWGRVHLIAHSLGSVMAVDILSQQPSVVPSHFGDPSCPEEDLPSDHFIFNTKSLFVCGSPVGFFLLLKKASLLPRQDKEKPGADSYAAVGVAGEQGTYGCIAVDNIYNIINPYDPVAYRLNAAIDVSYSESLKPAVVPSADGSWLAIPNPFRKTAEPGHGRPMRPSTARLPSNVEMETHNFTREEIAEKRAYLLNDNGQIDYFLKYGGGALQIQYLTMLGAHSSYWISRDFVRLIVTEVGRPFGKEGTLPAMRAQKKTAVHV